MNKFKILIGVVGSIMVLITILIVISIIKLSQPVEYEYYVAKNNDNETVYEWDNEDIMYRFRWTNENLPEGPYHLFMSIRVYNEDIKNVYINNIDIQSSKNKEYKFTSINKWPFLIYNADKKDNHLEYSKNDSKKRYYEFNDKFDFNFHDDETFTMILDITYEGENINKTERIKIEYVPYLFEFRPGIV